MYPVNDFKLLNVYTKHFILDTWRVSEYAFVQIAPGNVLCDHNKYLMVCFEFLHGSRIICLPLNISKKLQWHYVFEKLEKAEIYRLHLCWHDTISTHTICLWKIRKGRDLSPSFLLARYNTTHTEEQHLPFKQTGTNTIFSSGYQSCNWPRWVPFCWQNPCSGCNSGIDFVVVLEYTFFQLLLFLLGTQDSKEAT